jgi:DNA-binding transcriptional MerR regulator
MKMRELEQRTGVNREVIRIMIREGLLPQPQRLSRNAAEYDEAHVRGIAAIRRLQQSTRLTFKEIRAAMAGNGGSPASAYVSLEELLVSRFGLENPQPVPISNLAERYPSAERDAHAFAAMGMLSIVGHGPDASLSLTDARLVEIWGAIREAGFVEESGFPPENIAFYRDAAQMVARNEARIFFQNSREKIDDEKSASMLHVALPLMLDFLGLLRMKAFLSELHCAVARSTDEAPASEPT